MRSLRAILLLLLLMPHLAGAATTLTETQQLHLQQQAIHILGGNANVISRWQGSIRPGIVGTPVSDTNSNYSMRMVQRIFSDIAEITRLPLEETDWRYQQVEDYLLEVGRSAPFTLASCSDSTKPCANFVVVFANVEQMRQMAKAIPLRPVYQQAMSQSPSPLCFFSPFQTGGMQIVQSLVYVRADLSAAMIETCLQEEIYQSFGMFSDATDSEFFSFNNREEPKRITDYDKKLLSAIYHPSVGPGAPAFQVVKLFMRDFGSIK